MKIFAVLTAAAISIVSAVDCDPTKLAPVAVTGANAVACQAATGYSAASGTIPTGDVLKNVCSTKACSDLIVEMNTVVTQSCTYLGKDFKTEILDKFPVACAQALGGSAPTTTPATTTPAPAPTTVKPAITSPASTGATPVATTTAPTPATPTPTATTGALTPSPAENSSSRSSVGLIGGITAGLVLVLGLLAFFLRKRRREHKSALPQPDIEAGRQLSPITTEVEYLPLDAKPNSIVPPRRSSSRDRTGPTATNSRSSTQQSSRDSNSVGSDSSGNKKLRRHGKADGFWEDPIILANRIPRDTVFFGPLISRGGYGQVFKGTYQGETVAIKQLLPERRNNLTHIDEFLAEVKLIASLDHERVVGFIGVAWTALSDACVVVEYMERADLRSVLTQWDARNSNDEANSDCDEQEASQDWRPRGFDADKVKIAVHVAHALTYLHSLQPVVVHRDLKSRNILLNQNLDAKVTDFGVSRERANETMTAGVGSSLWMAPEVMVGARYDEKADVFSFGVVLSELDTHKLPYWHAIEPGTGRKLPDVAILQLVSLGRLRVAFSEDADADLVQLAHECVSVDPLQRPTAAQALHRVHSIMRTRY